VSPHGNGDGGGAGAEGGPAAGRTTPVDVPTDDDANCSVAGEEDPGAALDTADIGSGGLPAGSRASAPVHEHPPESR
jgi:hypothetical protein